MPKRVRSALWDLHYSHAKAGELPLARDTKLVLRNFDMPLPTDLCALRAASEELGEWHAWLREELQTARDALSGKKQAADAAQAALRTAWDAKQQELEVRPLSESRLRVPRRRRPGPSSSRP